MPDLLGVTNPVPGHDNTNITNRNIPISPGNTQVQNVPDLDRVTGADHRTEQQDASQSGSQVRYDSNYQTFIQNLRDTQDLSSTLSKLMMKEGTSVASGMSEGIAEEMSQAMAMLKMDQSELLRFLTAQMKAGTRFGGALFALLRSAYGRAESAGVQADILNFLKSYNDFSSTAHLEGNLMRNLTGMANSMPSSWGDQLRDLIAQMENSLAAGDRQGSISLLQQKVFPLMANYVSQTHDLGKPRELLTMLALDLARYENGSEEKLEEAFHQLSGYGTLKGMLGGIDNESMMKLLQSSQFAKNTSAAQFADHLAAAAARALRGEGSAEVQDIFRNLVKAMLVNESVYMPLNHFLIPMEMDDKMLFSELWVDPDAEEKNERGQSEKCMKFLFKLDVQGLGFFDVVLSAKERDVGIVVSCPEGVVPFSKEIEQNITKILTRNDLRPAAVSVRKMERPVTLTEVFPKIFEGKNSVNVKV